MQVILRWTLTDYRGAHKLTLDVIGVSCFMLPEIGYVRIWQIIGDRKKGIAPIIPVSKATWWAGVESGRYPKGVLLGPRTRAWDVREIRGLLPNGGAL